MYVQGWAAVQISLKGRVTSVHVNFASAFCKICRALRNIWHYACGPIGKKVAGELEAERRILHNLEQMYQILAVVAEGHLSNFSGSGWRTFD